MKIQVKVKPNARQDSLELLEDGTIKASIKAPPVEGKANEYLIRFLSSVLQIPKSSIEITSGHSSSYKRLEIDIDESLFLSKLDLVK
jgi:uncharacterized protein